MSEPQNEQFFERPNEESTTPTKEAEPPRCEAIAKQGINTANDFANLHSALISDLISGKVPPNVGQAICSAGRNLLKAVEMQYRYGTQKPGLPNKVLVLANHP